VICFCQLKHAGLLCLAVAWHGSGHFAVDESIRDACKSGTLVLGTMVLGILKPGTMESWKPGTLETCNLGALELSVGCKAGLTCMCGYMWMYV